VTQSTNPASGTRTRDAKWAKYFDVLGTPKDSGSNRNEIEQVLRATRAVRNTGQADATLLERAREALLEPGRSSSTAAPLSLELVRAGFPRIATTVFARFELRRAPDLPAALLAAPTVEAIAQAIKTDKAARGAVQAIMDTRPADAYRAAVADWSAAKLPLKTLMDLGLRAMRADPRPHHLKSPDELSQRLLGRDKDGSFTRSVARHLLDQDTDRASWIWAELISNARHVTWLCDAVGDAIEHGPRPTQLVAAIDHFAGLCLAQDRDLRLRSSLLLAAVRLRSEMAYENSSAASYEELRTALRDSTRAVLDATCDSAATADTWLAVRPGELKAAGSETQSSDVAREIAQTLCKVDEGADGRDGIETIAHNVGLTEIGPGNAEVPFDPLQHEMRSGTAGSLETVRVLRRGWRMGKRVLARALVVPLSTTGRG
jgi:hypothetical protein